MLKINTNANRKAWTLSTSWYLSQNVFKMFKPPISVGRDYITGLVLKLCRDANVTREALGIITGARAELYFDGSWSSVSFDKIEELCIKRHRHVIHRKGWCTLKSFRGSQISTASQW